MWLLRRLMISSSSSCDRPVKEWEKIGIDQCLGTATLLTVKLTVANQREHVDPLLDLASCHLNGHWTQSSLLGQ